MKFEPKYTPLYEERNKVINGEYDEELPKAEFSNIEKVHKMCGLTEEDIKKGSNEEKQKGIPQFWLKALKESELIGKLISEADEKIMEHITNINTHYEEGLFDFTITFHFSENKYFNHKTLSKKYCFNDKTTEVCKTEATEIEWNSEELDPKIKKVTKKTKSKKGGMKTTTTTKEVPSFFRFFESLSLEIFKEKEIGDEKVDEEDVKDQFAETLEAVYEFGVNLKDEVLPHAVEYFLGIVPDQEEGDCCEPSGACCDEGKDQCCG